MDWLTNTNSIISIIVGLTILVPSSILAIKKFRSNYIDIEYPASVAGRFITLFEAHGVHRNQIPSFFDHGLTLHHFGIDSELLKHLDDDILRDAAKLFAVNLEWLQGATEQPYETHHFDQSLNACEEFLCALKASGNALRGYVMNSDLPRDNDEYNAAIVIKEEIGEVNGRTISRLHICGGWLFNRWKSRAYMAACASIMMNNSIWLIGKQSQCKWLSQFCKGHRLPEYDYQDSDFSFPLRKTWYVDELLEQPIKYLEGIDPEKDNFAIKAAISKWLELEADGYMCINKYNNREKIRAYFENYDVC